jgi:hypothetical protein
MGRRWISSRMCSTTLSSSNAGVAYPGHVLVASNVLQHGVLEKYGALNAMPCSTVSGSTVASTVTRTWECRHRPVEPRQPVGQQWKDVKAGDDAAAVVDVVVANAVAVGLLMVLQLFS